MLINLSRPGDFLRSALLLKLLIHLL